MYKMNKKGLSQIIQTSLIMLLSIVAIFFVWTYVKNLSSDLESQLSPAVDCITQQSKILSACVNNEGKVLVNLDIKEKLNIAEFRLKDESFSCGEYLCSSCYFSDVNSQTIYLEPKTPALNQDSLVGSINRCTPEAITINPCL